MEEVWRFPHRKITIGVSFWPSHYRERERWDGHSVHVYIYMIEYFTLTLFLHLPLTFARVSHIGCYVFIAKGKVLTIPSVPQVLKYQEAAKNSKKKNMLNFSIFVISQKLQLVADCGE